MFNVLGNECGLHRLWCHKSYKTQPWKEWILHVFAVPLLYGSSIVYAGIHRQHHAYSDTEKDPHITRPWWKAVFYVRNKKHNIEHRFVSDLTKSPIHRWIHRNYFIINAGLLFVMLLAIGPILTGWTLSFMVIYNFLTAGLVNVLGHRPEYGARTFDTNDRSSNNLLVQIVSWNEGLHNHHHHNAGAWDFRVNRHDFDFPALWIKYFFMKK
jgi:stearoyl-CoA desaturase (delta-9 desaturase)